jgi:hypothetical protein
MKLPICLMLCAMTLGCGYGSNYNSTTGGMNAVPTLAQITPNTATAGGPAFTLTLTGTNFTAGTIVYWGTTPLTSSSNYLSPSSVTASITAAMIANSGTVTVYVHTAGGNSNSAQFTIQ